MQDYCPLCRTERFGSARFCRSCRFDFDPPAARRAARSAGRFAAADVAGQADSHAARRGPIRALLALAFAVVVGLTGLSTDLVRHTGSPLPAFVTAPVSPPTRQQVAAAPDAAAQGTSPSAAGIAAGPRGQTTRAKVLRVIDADTILVAIGGSRREVRYLGIATPAAVGRQARAANQALVAGRTVVLEADASDTDRAGRLLRYVWLQRGSAWTLVNLELVRRGFATVDARSAATRYADRYATAERNARARHLGWWDPAARPKHKPKPNGTPKPTKPPKHTKPDTSPPSNGRP